MVPSRTRWIALKGLKFRQGDLTTAGLPVFAPFGSVSDNPVGQGAFKSDVVPGFFRLNPFVPQNFFPLSLELAIQRGVFDQVIAVGTVRVVRHKIRYSDVTTM